MFKNYQIHNDVISRGHKRQLFVNKMGELLWTLFMNSRGLLFRGEFSCWLTTPLLKTSLLLLPVDFITKYFEEVIDP
jgi:hypothetical protein